MGASIGEAIAGLMWWRRVKSNAAAAATVTEAVLTRDQASGFRVWRRERFGLGF